MLYTFISPLGPYTVQPFPDDAAAQAYLEEMRQDIANQRGPKGFVPTLEFLALLQIRRATAAEAAAWRRVLAFVRREKGPGVDQRRFMLQLPDEWPGRHDEARLARLDEMMREHLDKEQ